MAHFADSIVIEDELTVAGAKQAYQLAYVIPDAEIIEVPGEGGGPSAPVQYWSEA